MANLLQISEPGSGTTGVEEQQEYAVGIDLGTTNSLVAYSSKQQAAIINSPDNKGFLKSVMSYNNEQDFISSTKRIMGKSYTEAANLANLPFKVKEGSNNTALIQPFNVTAIQVASDILKELKTWAEQSLKQPVNKAVITVPAYFDDNARKATKDAANIAGLEVLRLINEPTAAALAYGLENQEEGVFAIYDFGGGTFDISVLKITKGVFKVLSTGGDTVLGGDDIDFAIAKHLNISVAKAVQVKHHFSKSNASYKLDSQELTLKAYNQLILPIIERTINITQRVVKDAGLNKQDIDEVILVGGSTRVGLVQEKLTEYFGKQPKTNIDPDKAVAIGAALQAESLTRGSDNLLLDVLPLSLGVETYGGITDKIVERNSAIPCEVAKEFTTYKDNQTGIIINIVQGEREMAEDCRSLAKFELKGIPAMKAGVARVQVSFKIDADGLLTVTATEQKTNAKQSVEVKPSFGLTEQEIIAMISSSMKNSGQDMQDRFLQEAIVRANNFIDQIYTAFKENAELLEPSLKDKVDKLNADLIKATSNNDKDSINAIADELNSCTEGFAMQIMNKKISEGLKGNNVENI